MSMPTLVETNSRPRLAMLTMRIADYVELTKPRIMTMVLVTIVLTSTIATWGQPDLLKMVHTIIGTVLVAGSASLFNQWLEIPLDARMQRTQDRPLPAGRLGQTETLVVGSVSVLLGLAYLLNTTTTTTTFWAAMTWLMYVGIYTPLKTRTWLNTLAGAFPGAMPVLIAWSGTEVAFDMRTWCLFLLVFLWQFPHFMAIAWLYRRQYASVGMKMLTVVDPTGVRAGRQAIAAAIAVLIVSLVPATLAMQISITYLLSTSLLGLWQLRHAILFARQPDDSTARKLLRASIVYLPLQLIAVTMLNLAII